MEPYQSLAKSNKIASSCCRLSGPIASLCNGGDELCLTRSPFHSEYCYCQKFHEMTMYYMFCGLQQQDVSETDR